MFWTAAASKARRRFHHAPTRPMPGQARRAGRFISDGRRGKQGKDANTALPKRGESAEQPVGEWNTCKMVCAGNSIKALINGKLMNETTECMISSGKIGFQSEGAELEIRKVFIEPIKP